MDLIYSICQGNGGNAICTMNLTQRELGGVQMVEAKVEEKNIALAFFDILGTSEKIRCGQYDRVYEFYSYMVDLCAEEQIPISFSNLPGHFGHGGDIVLNFPMKHAFFSDTFIVWVEYEDFFGMSLRGFYEKCMDIFVEAIKRGIPLRGAISRGTAIMDEERKLYLGKPIVEAARAEAAQNWMGIALTRSCQEASISEAWLLLPYTEHIKEAYRNKQKSKDVLFTNCVLDWPKYWRNTQDNEVISLIQKMNDDATFSSYYDNAIRFVNYSKENDDFWKDKLPPPPPLVPFIVMDP